MIEPAIELMALVLAAWPALRLVATPAFRRRLAAHPRHLAILGCGLAGYLAALLLLAIGPPALLRTAAGPTPKRSMAAWAASRRRGWLARPR